MIPAFFDFDCGLLSSRVYILILIWGPDLFLVLVFVSVFSEMLIGCSYISFLHFFMLFPKLRIPSEIQILAWLISKRKVVTQLT